MNTKVILLLAIFSLIQIQFCVQCLPQKRYSYNAVPNPLALELLKLDAKKIKPVKPPEDDLHNTMMGIKTKPFSYGDYQPFRLNEPESKAN